MLGHQIHIAAGNRSCQSGPGNSLVIVSSSSAPTDLQSLIDQGSEQSGDRSQRLCLAVGPRRQPGEDVSKAEPGRRRCTTGGFQLLRTLSSL